MWMLMMHEFCRQEDIGILFVGFSHCYVPSDLWLHVNLDPWEDQLGEIQPSVDYELIPEYFCDHSI